MIFSFITMPTPASTTEMVGSYSAQMFSDLWEPAIIVAGCFIGVAILIIIKNAFLDAFDRIAFERATKDFDQYEPDDYIVGSELERKYKAKKEKRHKFPFI